MRSYLDKKVDKELVKEILEVSKRAPSGVNSQPWKIYVVMGHARDKLVNEACERFDKGELEKNIRFIQLKDLTGIRSRQRASGFAL